MFIPVFAFAQWSNNPGTPLRICPVNSAQFGPWIYSDGAEGQIIFWTDYRNGGNNSNYKLFAQHLDANGNRLFPDSGKLILNHPSKKTDYSIARDASGNFWIAFVLTTTTRMDSLVIQRFNGSSFSPVWANIKKIAAINSTDFNVLYPESIQILPQGDSAYIQYNVTWMGGATVKFVNRISSNGTVRFGNGKSFSGFNQNYGPCVSLLNDDGTFLLIQRNGNGLGTGVNAWMFDKNLNLKWGPKSLTGGTSGLGYAFQVLPDGVGGFIMGYITAGNDFMATRMDSLGNFVWTPNHKPVCNYSSSQDSPQMIKVGDFIYGTWTDSRSPAANADIFLQKIDLQGNRLWNPNGRRVFRLNSYIPTPKIIADDSANIIVTSLQSSTGFVAQKVRPDSSFAWPGYGMLICSPGSYNPFYGSYRLSIGSGGKAFVAWKNGDQNNGQIYAAALANNGTLFSDSKQVVELENDIIAYPNPSSDGIFHLNMSDIQPGHFPFTVHSISGKEVYSGIWNQEQNQILDLKKQPAGMYCLKIMLPNRVKVVRMEKW